MHRTHQTKILCLMAMALAQLATTSFSQVGPNPTEIPQVLPEPVVTSRPMEPSDSESARPAIDALLLSAAGEYQTTASSNTEASNQGSVARDVRAQTGSMLIGRPAQIVGSPSPVGDDQQADLASSEYGYFQTIIALAGVILLILGLGQVYKHLARSQGGLAGQLGAGGSAPSGIIEVIGRYPISKGMTLVVLKFDRRVLLLSHASGSKGKGGQFASMQVLSELTDPEDIASILLKSRSESGDTIAQSFEQTLREADSMTDEHLRGIDLGYSEVNPIRYPAHRSEPVRTITTDEGDRAELWSSGQDSEAAAGVLRRRLASMRREPGE